ncbi:hypothetical protein [Rhodococcus gordoniae]
MNAAQAVSVEQGRFQLVLGDEIAVTAREESAVGERVRLVAQDLKVAARVLTDSGVECGEWEALVVLTENDKTLTFHGSCPKDATMEVRGASDDVAATFRAVDPTVREALLAEAVSVAWRQRLSDAADTVGALTPSDVEIVGAIDVAGSPTLLELRAERRRLLSRYEVRSVSIEPDARAFDAIDSVVENLRAAVGYGAAGLIDASTDQFGDLLESAVGDGGWVQRLRLLISAQEVAAIELAIASRNMKNPSSGSNVLDRLDKEYAETASLASLLMELAKRLPKEKSNRAQRLIRRKLHENVRTVRAAVECYISVSRSSGNRPTVRVTWDDALDALGQMDNASERGRALAIPLPASNGNSKTDEPVPTIDDIASLLGEIFVQQLPEAKKQIEALQRLHPEESVGAMIGRVKRQAATALRNSASDDGQPILKTVATLTMSVALLRGIDPTDEAELDMIGRRLLDRVQGIAAFQEGVHSVIPAAVASFEKVARRFQPVIVEAIFHALKSVAPQGAGPARDLYKDARSAVWRARFKRGIAAVVARKAGQALQVAVDSGTARLLVREVDRSLATVKHVHS